MNIKLLRASSEETYRPRFLIRNPILDIPHIDLSELQIFLSKALCRLGRDQDCLKLKKIAWYILEFAVPEKG